jgi:hypothetical protein
MTYTPYILFALGCLGILLHNLIKMDSLNRKSKGNLKLGQYFKLEWVSILISIIVVFVALIAQSEIKQLSVVGNYLELAFVAIGYMAQSIVVSYMGKAEKFLQTEDNSTSLVGDKPVDPRDNPKP